MSSHILNLKFIFERQSRYEQVFVYEPQRLTTECLKS
jgi:hypothetical protein